MIMNNRNANSFYLVCSVKNCKAKLAIRFYPPIRVEKIDGKNYLADSVTEEMLLATSNYGSVKGRYT